MHLIYLSLVLLYQIQNGLTQLTTCPKNLGLSSIGFNVTCYAERMTHATKRHKFYLLNFGYPSDAVYLNCPVCPEEDPKDFDWMFIPRNSPAHIFVQASDNVYGSNYHLNPTLLTKVPVVDKRLQCLIADSKDLYLSELDPERFMGTYVCQFRRNKTHPANFVWYHLDVINPMRVVMVPSSSPGYMEVVENMEQVERLKEVARRDLNAYEEWPEQTNGDFVMTGVQVEDDITVRRCGMTKLGLERQCFIRIPGTEPAMFRDLPQKLAYRALRDAFDFLASAPGYTMASGSRIRQSVQDMMQPLGFDFHGNGSYLYIPCGYSLLPYLFNVVATFVPFPAPTVRLEVTFDIVCDYPDLPSFIEFIRTSDYSTLNLTVESMIDFRYIKIQRLVLEGERDLRLRCPTTSGMTLRCADVSVADAIWRSGNGLTFDKRRSPEDNVYVTETCELRFEVVNPFDVDIYYCHLRDMNALTQVWSRRPRIAYRLQMEGSRAQFPRENDALVGLVVMITWSVALSVMWVLLNLYDSVTRESAMFEATVRHAGGRMARLKHVYSPFSDEDKALFFKVLPEE